MFLDLGYTMSLLFHGSGVSFTVKSQYHDIVNSDIVPYLLLELLLRPVTNIIRVINDALLDYVMIIKVRGQGQTGANRYASVLPVCLLQ